MILKRIVISLLCALTLLLSSYKGTQEKQNREKEAYATYYDYGFRNKLTACGKKYNPQELTCATRDRGIPFGTVMEITNVKNGKKVRVTITDRMSSKARYQLDLTPAAFRRIGELKTGKLEVKYRIIKKGDGKTYHHQNKKK